MSPFQLLFLALIFVVVVAGALGIAPGAAVTANGGLPNQGGVSVSGGGGGSIGGPAFHKIMSYVLQKYAVPPTGTTPAHLPVEW